jgi:hypothetical protein
VEILEHGDPGAVLRRARLIKMNAPLVALMSICDCSHKWLVIAGKIGNGRTKVGCRGAFLPWHHVTRKI